MGTRPDVTLHRNGVRIKGACIDEPINLTNAQIPCEVRLVHWQFNKSVTFNNASFVGSVSFGESTFKEETNFTRMKVGSAAIFDRAVFEGPVYFFGETSQVFSCKGQSFMTKLSSPV